ncbi:hypothetical protein QYF61_007389 [Mycteria americana]|uniref:Uncharacterized protein n=1 Tax=Mycteria americana TaxID=33587 RepID=A0AAN7N8M7_MYCAM|nr:hypothetical protein QYF61_007389 [Mycteria americana]
MVANALLRWLQQWKQNNWQRRGKPLWAAALWQDIAAWVENLVVKVHHVDAHVPKVQIHLSHFNLSSLIHLLVVLMFLSGPTLGYMSIYVIPFVPHVGRQKGLWWFSPSRQLSTTQLLAHSPLSTNQLMDGNQGVSVGAILPPVHRCGSNWHLLFFDPQQPHNRRVLRETRQGATDTDTGWFPGSAAVPIAGAGVNAATVAEVGVAIVAVAEEVGVAALNKPSDLSCSSQALPSRPFTILVALLWTHSNSLTSFLYCGTQNCTQYSRRNLAMVFTRQKAMPSVLARVDVATQMELPQKHAATQVSGCRECQGLSLFMDGSSEDSCVRCDQVDDLLCMVAELQEEVERLRSIREAEKEIDWWCHALPPRDRNRSSSSSHQ